MRKSLIAAALASLLAACTTTSPNVVQPYDAQRAAQVVDATVLSVRPVTVDGSQSGAGAVAGGFLGGLAGSSHSSGNEQAALGVLGAVVGAVMGNAIERGVTREDGVEILLQTRGGERMAIVQARNGETFLTGDAVVVITSNGRSRVTRVAAASQPAPTSQAPTAPSLPAPVQSAPRS